MLIIQNQEIAHHQNEGIRSKWTFEELRKIPEFGALIAF